MIDDCPALARNEKKVLRAFAGSDRCTFKQVEDSRTEFSQCMQDARDERDFRMALLKIAPDPK